jgi:HlyD family secretion protein
VSRELFIRLKKPSVAGTCTRVLLFFALLLSGCGGKFGKAREHTVSGTIEVDEARVASRYGGRVESVLAWEGDPLKPGQPIVKLSASELLPRQAQTAALLQELRAGARKEELQEAKADWEAKTADLEFARSEARRITELFQQQTVSASERDLAVSRASSLEKVAAAARSRYELLLAGTRPERIAQVEAQLREIETQIQEMDVLSPTNAVLEVLHVKVGDVLTPGREVATLILAGHLWVRVYVPETWLGHIKVGQNVTVRSDSFPGRDFNGQVEQIARAAEFTPRNVQTVEERVKQVFGIKVRLPADTDQLRAGMSVDAFFPGIPEALK